MRRFRLLRHGRKNERCFTRPQQLQLLANLELLLCGIALELLDAVAAVIVFALNGGVLLLHLADLVPFLAQRGKPVRTPQRSVSHHAREYEHTPENDAAHGIRNLQNDWSLHLFIILFWKKVQLWNEEI